MFVAKDFTTEAEETFSRIDSSEREELVKKFVHASIVLGQNGTPIRKTELNKLVLPANKTRLHNVISVAANQELDKIFGMRLFELGDKLRYILVNSSPDYSAYQERENAEELCVLHFTLMEILISPDETMSEEDIKNSLSPLEFSQSDLKEHLDSLVSKQYLTRRRHQDTSIYSWGQKATAEIEPEAFYTQFLETVSDTTATNEWPEPRKRIDKLKSIPNR